MYFNVFLKHHICERREYHIYDRSETRYNILVNEIRVKLSKKSAFSSIRNVLRPCKRRFSSTNGRGRKNSLHQSSNNYCCLNVIYYQVLGNRRGPTIHVSMYVCMYVIKYKIIVFLHSHVFRRSMLRFHESLNYNRDWLCGLHTSDRKINCGRRKRRFQSIVIQLFSVSHWIRPMIFRRFHLSRIRIARRW